jgi:hypothetical protein
MSEIIYFDGSELDEPASLGDHLRIQFKGERVESRALFTTLVRETAITIIRVTHKLRTRHQIYAIDERVWTLVGIYGLYADAMSELLRWRRYVNEGGTVRAWLLKNKGMVTPERSGLV